MHGFCTVAAGECGRWAEAERHALQSLHALRAAAPGELHPTEVRWRELSARHNALLARLQQVGEAGAGSSELRQRARELLQLLQEHCHAAADDPAAPADSLANLGRCASLLRLSAAVGKLCLRLLGRPAAAHSPTVRLASPRLSPLPAPGAW